MSNKPAKDSNTSPSAKVAGISDRQTLRERARKNIEDGAITDSYSADRKVVIKLLNDALATELVCVLRYKRHHFTAHGLASPKIAEEFLVHANAELAHADRLAERIAASVAHPAVSVVILGTTDIGHLAENVQAFEAATRTRLKDAA